MRFKLPRLIGITGRAGSGKDTLADYLVRQFGYVKYSLSKPIKDILNERFGWTEKDWENRAWKEAQMPHCGASVRNITINFSPRSWAQWLGTEVGRNIGGEDVWVNMMERAWRDLLEDRSMWADALMVVPDVRFNNEARRIHELGGAVIRVVRDGVADVNAHVSELGISDELVNVEVINDSDIITFLRNSVYALEAVPKAPEQGRLEFDAPLEESYQ